MYAPPWPLALRRCPCQGMVLRLLPLFRSAAKAAAKAAPVDDEEDEDGVRQPFSEAPGGGGGLGRWGRLEQDTEDKEREDREQAEAEKQVSWGSD